jgi:hypothetical protein
MGASSVVVKDLVLDAAISRNNDKGSLVAICRESRGLCMGASSVVVKDLVLEAMALREALSLAEDLYLRGIPIAIYCKRRSTISREGMKVQAKRLFMISR